MTLDVRPSGLCGESHHTCSRLRPQDADLLLLSLLCHEPHMRVLREAQGPSPYELKRAAAAGSSSNNKNGGGGNRREGAGMHHHQQQQQGSSSAAAGAGGLGLAAGATAAAAAASGAPPQGKDHHFEEVEIGVGVWRVQGMLCLT